MSEEVDTDKLLRRAADDPSALQCLMSRHRDRLRRMIDLRMDSRLRSRVDPSDIIQDAMTSAVRHLPTYLHDRPIAFYPWLRQLAWEHLVDAFRKNIVAQRRTVDKEVTAGARIEPDLTDQSVIHLANLLVCQQSSPSQKLKRMQMRQRVQTALDQIHRQYRELLVMRYLEELSIKEIADCLGATEAAIKMRHMRALKQLGSVLTRSDKRSG